MPGIYYSRSETRGYDDLGTLYSTVNYADGVDCPHGCGDNGECAKLIDTEGSDCSEGYNECVDDDIHAYCREGKVVAERCSGEGLMMSLSKCGEADGVAACVDNLVIEESCVEGATECVGDKFAECLKGLWTVMDCSDGATCQILEDGAAYCVAPDEE